MTKQSLSKATGLLSRGLRASTNTTTTTTSGAIRFARGGVLTSPAGAALVPAAARSRFLSTTSPQRKGILPDSEDPSPPDVQEHAHQPAPAKLSDGEYHELADEYLEVVLAQLEQIADRKESVEVEYSVCALSLPFPPPAIDRTFSSVGPNILLPSPLLSRPEY